MGYQVEPRRRAGASGPIVPCPRAQRHRERGTGPKLGGVLAVLGTRYELAKEEGVVG